MTMGAFGLKRSPRADMKTMAIHRRIGRPHPNAAIRQPLGILLSLLRNLDTRAEMVTAKNWALSSTGYFQILLRIERLLAVFSELIPRKLQKVPETPPSPHVGKTMKPLRGPRQNGLECP
jgi:hypothetical protein